LTAWEQAGLIPANDNYSFEDLAQLRTLRTLRATRISAKSIRESVEAMRRAAGMGNPFTEASAVGRGTHLSFRHNGALVDPVTRQLAFDFEAGTRRQLSIVGSATHASSPEPDVQELFQRAVHLEEVPATISQAADLYRQILAMRPAYAAAATTTCASSPWPNSSIAAPPRPTPTTPSPSSIWAMCSTR
jgi:plasmid stability protein